MQTENTARYSCVKRQTKETDISIALTLDGSGSGTSDTGIDFLDHMLHQTIRHGFMDAEIKAVGDIAVDCHHTAEDVGIVFGQAMLEALGDKKGITRYGFAITPMEDALCLCALDFSGRPYVAYDNFFTVPKLGDLDSEMIEEFFRAFCIHSGCNIHIKILSGKNNHHIAESIFKAFGQAIAQAVTIDLRIDGIRSTKGML